MIKINNKIEELPYWEFRNIDTYYLLGAIFYQGVQTWLVHSSLDCLKVKQNKNKNT